MLSGYQIRVGEKKAIVGFHGSFWSDPVSFDLQRLEVIADDIPPELGLASATDRVDYRAFPSREHVSIASGSELRMVDLGGSENRNQIRFTACRQYSGESVISFADPTPETTASAEPRATKELELPGDWIHAVADRSARVKEQRRGRSGCSAPSERREAQGHVMIPKGAVVSGRVTTLQKTSEVTSLG